MQRKSKISKVAAPLMIVCGLLITASVARADDGRECSNRALHGDYGFAIDGMLLGIPGFPPGAGLPLRGVALTHFDGKGGLTQVDHIVVNGMPPPLDWTPGQGTYTVNPDCTGTAVINSASSPSGPLKLHLVVVRDGKEIRTVVDTNAVTSVGIKVE